MRIKPNWGHSIRIDIDEFAQRKGNQNFDTVVSDINKGNTLEINEGSKKDK